MKSPLYFHRETIEKQLKRIRKCPITAVTAPMGYGKTVLVKNYLLDRKATACWLSLNRGDNSLKYFWDKLIHALMRVRSDVGSMVDLGFPDSDEKIAAVFNMFIHGKDLGSERYVVFDNYQYINNQKIHELLQYIAQERIDGLHIILIMRGNVPANFIEMIINNTMCVIGPGEFEFSADDVCNYFAFSGIEITPEQAKLVRRNTGGWITAIYLVMLAYREDGNLNRIPSNLEQVVETNIYSKFEPKAQEILMKLSVLDTFSREAAINISGEPDAGKYMDNLVSQSTFVRFNPKANEYILHPVLRVLLKHKLLARHGGDISAITKRAGEYLITHESYVIGLSMLNKAGDYEGIADVLKERPFSFWNQLELEELLRFFATMPRTIKQNYFVVYLRFLLFLSFNNRCEEAQRLIREAWDIYDKSWMCGGDAEGKLRGEILMVESVCYAFCPEHAVQCLRQAQRLLPRGSMLISKKVIFPSHCINPVAVTHEVCGGLEDARDMCIEICNMKYRLTRGVYCVGGSELCRGEYYYLRGELSRAAPLFYIALQKAQNGDDLSTAMSSVYFLIQILIIDGEFDKIVNLKKAQKQAAHENRDREAIGIYEMFRDNIHAAIGDRRSIIPGSSSDEIFTQSFSKLEPSWRYLMMANIAVSMQRWHDVIKLCMKMKTYFGKNHKIIGQIYSNIFEAVATLRLYSVDFARVYLEAALNLAEKDSIVMPFVEYAEHILGLIELIRDEGEVKAEFADKIISMCRLRMKGLEIIREKNAARGPDVEFTPRERELMRNLIDCESNKEIAGNMGVKVGTVKKMMYNVFRKLNVTCRSAAVKKIIGCNIRL